MWLGSTIARETDVGVHNHAGPEIAVASTKAFIPQLTALVLLTVFLGREKTISIAEAVEILTELEQFLIVLSDLLEQAPAIEVVAKKHAHYHTFIYIGRKLHTPIVYEGALKPKEVTYIHAEAYAGGELKHGPITMLGSDFPVFAIAPKDDVYEKMLSNIEEVRARQTPVILFTTDEVVGVADVADDVIYMSKVHPILQPIVSTIPLHLFAYYVGVAKDFDVDQLRNLAKSVTVE